MMAFMSATASTLFAISRPVKAAGLAQPITIPPLLHHIIQRTSSTGTLSRAFPPLSVRSQTTFLPPLRHHHHRSSSPLLQSLTTAPAVTFSVHHSPPRSTISSTSGDGDAERVMVDTILDYWFGSPSPPPRHSTLPNKRELWYKGGAAIDTDIRQRFGTHVDNALAGDYDHIAALHSVHGIRGALAVIVLLDQLTRNVFRGSAAAFKGDAKAKGITESIWSSEECQTLPFVWRVSFIMPWMHDESPTSQSRACEELKSMLKQLDAEEKEYKEEEIADCRKMLQMNLSFAEKHGVIIEQFGRFPYRNDVLGRETTEAELVYLKDGDRFGQ